MLTPLFARMKRQWLYSSTDVQRSRIRGMNPRAANDLAGTITIDPAGVAVVPPLFDWKF